MLHKYTFSKRSTYLLYAYVRSTTKLLESCWCSALSLSGTETITSLNILLCLLVCQWYFVVLKNLICSSARISWKNFVENWKALSVRTLRKISRLCTWLFHSMVASAVNPPFRLHSFCKYLKFMSVITIMNWLLDWALAKDREYWVRKIAFASTSEQQRYAVCSTCQFFSKNILGNVNCGIDITPHKLPIRSS